MTEQDFFKFVSAAAGVIAVVVGIRTLFWRRLQLRSFRQSEKFQNDTHVLQLCQALSDPSPRLRMAAAALLVERLERSRIDTSEAHERNAIVQALLAATVGGSDRGTADAASPELCKYIADAVVDVLGARRTPRPSNIMHKYYWQRVHVNDAYWAGICARGVDFWGANLSNASLRRADLEGAVFYEATLSGAKLAGANLKRCDFRAADLSGADLRDDDRTAAAEKNVKATVVDEARWTGAKYNGTTRFPTGFDPVAVGMVRVD